MSRKSTISRPTFALLAVAASIAAVDCAKANRSLPCPRLISRTPSPLRTGSPWAAPMRASAFARQFIAQQEVCPFKAHRAQTVVEVLIESAFLGPVRPPTRKAESADAQDHVGLRDASRNHSRRSW